MNTRLFAYSNSLLRSECPKLGFLPNSDLAIGIFCSFWICLDFLGFYPIESSIAKRVFDIRNIDNMWLIIELTFLTKKAFQNQNSSILSFLKKKLMLLTIYFSKTFWRLVIGDWIALQSDRNRGLKLFFMNTRLFAYTKFLLQSECPKLVCHPKEIWRLATGDRFLKTFSIPCH